MNRILYASDCLKILQDRDALPDESVDLIYLDPPFNSNSNYNLPFKGKYKTAVPAKAFEDTWHWGDDNTEQLKEMDADPRTRSLANIVRFAQGIDRGLAAYLMNMAVRLAAMGRVLKPTGSIYLHCDPTASHYLKLVMDCLFGRKNFRNEVIWAYRTGGVSKRWFGRKHDVILFYVKSEKIKYTFNVLKERSYNRDFKPYRFKGVEEFQDEEGKWYTMATMRDIWEINAVGRTSGERLGYPTQKPLALLERIIEASCPPDGIILDPFCGCGTTLHAAESLGRQWVGIDISSFATGLVRDRIVKAFVQLEKTDISMRGEIPTNIHAARSLAKLDKFEFEKWVCGQIGAEGMFHNPGTPGADGGVDGVMRFYTINPGEKWETQYAIVQVKGGHVTPDAVRALRETVDRFEVTAGVMVCFDQYMSTVENQRSKETFSDALGTYPIIQGYSVENLLADAPLNLPLYGFKRQGALLTG